MLNSWVKGAPHQKGAATKLCLQNCSEEDCDGWDLIWTLIPTHSLCSSLKNQGQAPGSCKSSIREGKIHGFFLPSSSVPTKSYYCKAWYHGRELLLPSLRLKRFLNIFGFSYLCCISEMWSIHPFKLYADSFLMRLWANIFIGVRKLGCLQCFHSKQEWFLFCLWNAKREGNSTGRT